MWHMNKMYFAMQDLRFGRTLSFPLSGLLTTTPRQAVAIPTGGKGVGSLKKLRQFNYHLCSFICLFNPCLISDGIYLDSREPEMDLMDVIVRVIVIENEGHDHLKVLRTIATGENNLLSTNHTLFKFPRLWSFSLKILFSVFSPWSEERCPMRSAPGRIILEVSIWRD